MVRENSDWIAVKIDKELYFIYPDVVEGEGPLTKSLMALFKKRRPEIGPSDGWPLRLIANIIIEEHGGEIVDWNKVDIKIEHQY